METTTKNTLIKSGTGLVGVLITAGVMYLTVAACKANFQDLPTSRFPAQIK